MFMPTLVMGILALVFLLIGYLAGEGKHLAGLKTAARMTLEILPLLLFAFIIAGMVQVLVPKELISRWVGAESGFKGILIGTFAGGFTPGGPYVSLPIVAGLLKSGAGIGTMVAFLTSWSLWAIARLPMEFGMLGWRFTVVRLAATFFFPPIAGLLAQYFASYFKV
ncbi:MAG TPA: permease [Candidatus Deferrimicrobium sp.]|nr:permease [Candidatus Deferrimicrobium sp.]